MRTRLTCLLFAACLAVPVIAADKEPATAKASATRVPYGKTKGGEAVDLFVLTTPAGVTAKIMTYGATVSELWVPDSNGKLADVLLGFDDLKGWQSKGNP